MVGGSSMIGFSLVKAVSKRDMPGIEPGPLGWQTSALTNELQEVSITSMRSYVYTNAMLKVFIFIIFLPLSLDV